MIGILHHIDCGGGPNNPPHCLNLPLDFRTQPPSASNGQDSALGHACSMMLIASPLIEASKAPIVFWSEKAGDNYQYNWRDGGVSRAIYWVAEFARSHPQFVHHCNVMSNYPVVGIYDAEMMALARAGVSTTVPANNQGVSVDFQQHHLGPTLIVADGDSSGLVAGSNYGPGTVGIAAPGGAAGTCGAATIAAVWALTIRCANPSIGPGAVNNVLFAYAEKAPALAGKVACGGWLKGDPHP